MRKKPSWTNIFTENGHGRVPENLNLCIRPNNESCEMIFLKFPLNEEAFSENPIKMVIFWIVEQILMKQGITK